MPRSPPLSSPINASFESNNNNNNNENSSNSYLRWVRLATVIGYMICVSAPAIILSVYYIYFWDPNYAQYFTNCTKTPLECALGNCTIALESLYPKLASNANITDFEMKCLQEDLDQRIGEHQKQLRDILINILRNPSQSLAASSTPKSSSCNCKKKNEINNDDNNNNQKASVLTKRSLSPEELATGDLPTASTSAYDELLKHLTGSSIENEHDRSTYPPSGKFYSEITE